MVILKFLIGRLVETRLLAGRVPFKMNPAAKISGNFILGGLYFTLDIVQRDFLQSHSWLEDQ